MLDPWSLRVLLAVADQGSFSAAGDALVLSQPAVSRQIAGLEARLGVRLFRRLPRGVVLTPIGERAVGLARTALGALERMEAELAAEATGAGGTLRMAAFASANTHLVPEALRRFAATHPAVATSLLHVDPFEVLPAVAAGRVEVAVLTSWQLFAEPATARLDPEPATLDPQRVEDVDLVPLLDEDLCVALPTRHRLADRATVRLRDLRDEPWVEGAYPDCLGPVARLAEALGGPPRIAYTCHDWNGKQALVAGGAGVMLVPTLARQSLRRGIVLRPVTPQLPARRLYAAASAPPYRTVAADDMVALLVDVAAGLRSAS